jgi:hypothetical protein
MLMRGSRALILGVLGVAMYLAVGVWAVVTLAEGDWFIDGGDGDRHALPSLSVRVVRTRRQERRSAPAGNKPASIDPVSRSPLHCRAQAGPRRAELTRPVLGRVWG